jgi:hypothetical protein
MQHVLQVCACLLKPWVFLRTTQLELVCFPAHRPHVTLVSGTNGSGKSAVMQGLQVCLGVSAKATGRAGNMGAFIRTGAQEARVQVGGPEHASSTAVVHRNLQSPAAAWGWMRMPARKRPAGSAEAIGSQGAPLPAAASAVFGKQRLQHSRHCFPWSWESCSSCILGVCQV